MTTPAQGASPACPRCRAGLFAGNVGHLAALGCGACGGLWLDNAGTTAVLDHYDLDASTLARLIDGHAQTPNAPSPFADASAGCPVCAEPLKSVDHRGVRLDFCAKHGTFFDRGELARIVQANVPAAAAPAPATGPSITDITTVVRHEAAWQNDPITTTLMDWATGGPDWVNRWRR